MFWLMFFDLLQESFKLGWTSVMIAEQFFPKIVDKLWIMSTYFSTFCSLSFCIYEHMKYNKKVQFLLFILFLGGGGVEKVNH